MSRKLSLTIFFVDVFLLLLFTFSRWHVSIEIFGDEEMEIPYGSSYVEEGAAASFLGKDLTLFDRQLPVSIKGEVDTNVPGTYDVEYKASRLFYSRKVHRVVNVVDRVSPELMLGSVNTELEMGDVWSDSYTARDNCDGDLSSLVVINGEVDTSKPGTYVLEYSVTDSSGNTATAEREVFVDEIAEPVTGSKIIFLTYDDGPCENTDTLLEILDRYGVKATFFVTANGGSYIDRIGMEAAAGHTVAVHTFSHDYRKIYQSSEAYWEDFDAMNAIIEQYTGRHSRLFRFPGGASNTVSNFNHGIMTELTNEAREKGYEYFDWNVDVSEGGGGDTREGVYHNAISAIPMHDVSVVLFHDTHLSNVLATEDIIQWGLENGYTFLPLVKGITVCHHGVNN